MYIRLWRVAGTRLYTGVTMQNRNRLSLEDPLPVSEMYRQRHIKLASRLITDWQRVGVALDLLIRAGEIPPGKSDSCTSIYTLLGHRTTTFEKTFEVYQKSIVRDVLDVIAPADSRSRRRHNAIINNLATARLKGRYVLPAPAAQARDTAAREELWRLAARLPDGLPDDLPAFPVSLRPRVEAVELNPEMVEAVYARRRAEAEIMDMDDTPTRDVDLVEPGADVENLDGTHDVDLVEPDASVENLDGTRDVDLVEPDASVENLDGTRDVDLVEPDASVENLDGTRDVDLVEPDASVENLDGTRDVDLVEPDASVENLDGTRDEERTTEEKLADIVAAGRRPDPNREFYEYLLWQSRVPVPPAAPPAPRMGLLSWLPGKGRKERT